MSFSRTYTTYGSSSTVSNDSRTNNDSIIFAIVTNNITEFKRLITRDNVNRIIDTKNRYTALHYAIQMRNEEMIRYLSQFDAEPTIKNNEGQDAFDMSIRYQIRTLIDAEFQEKNNTIKTQQQTINSTKDKVVLLEKQVVFLESTISKVSKERDVFKSENSGIKTENVELKKNNAILKQSNTELDSKYKEADASRNQLKRKVEELDKMIDTLIGTGKKSK